MKSKKFIGAALAAFLTIYAVGAQAQTSSSQYVISAKAGGINSASGDVKVRRKGANNFQLLASNDALGDGDVITTGEGGRVEMLLSPGAYFRAAENSEFELENSSLDNLRVKLNKGSAIIEATGMSGANMFVEIRTPQTAVALGKRGIYRVNVLPSRQSAVYVREGYALVGNIKVKESRTLTVGANGASENAIAKFDEKERDAFDMWSESRAETLVAVNKKLTRNAIRDSYSAYNRGGFGRGYRGSGLWLYNSSFGAHTFLPFYSGLSSPYGYGYSHGFGFSSYDFGSGFSAHRGHRVIYAAPRHNRTHTTTHQSSPRHQSSGHHRRGH